MPDAIAMVCRLNQVKKEVAQAVAFMKRASREVLDGPELAVEVKIFKYPARYSSKKGLPMWEEITKRI